MAISSEEYYKKTGVKLVSYQAPFGVLKITKHALFDMLADPPDTPKGWTIIAGIDFGEGYSQEPDSGKD